MEREGEVGREIRGREGEMRKERGRRRRRGGEMRKGIIMALLLVIGVLMISCGNAGPVPKEGQAATADGTIIDLAKVSDKIRNAFEFVTKSEEVKALVKSIDELAKGIGKKIQASVELGTEADYNTSLMAGVYSVGLDIVKKAQALKNLASIKELDLEQKVTSVISASEAFVNKLKTENSTLGRASGAAQDTEVKKAIDIANGDKSRGGTELIALNTAIGNLLTAANEVLKGIIKEVKEPAKINTNKAN